MNYERTKRVAGNRIARKYYYFFYNIYNNEFLQRASLAWWLSDFYNFLTFSGYRRWFADVHESTRSSGVCGFPFLFISYRARYIPAWSVLMTLFERHGSFILVFIYFSILLFIFYELQINTLFSLVDPWSWAARCPSSGSWSEEEPILQLSTCNALVSMLP